MPNGPYRRSTSDRKIAGVCGGLAKYFGLDATLVRVLWVILTLVSFGAGLLGYILLWILASEDTPRAPAAAPTPPPMPAAAPPAPARAAPKKPAAAAPTKSAKAKPKAKPKA